MKKSLAKKLAIGILSSFFLIIASPSFNTFAQDAGTVTDQESGNDEEPKQNNIDRSALAEEFSSIASALDNAQECIDDSFDLTIQNPDQPDQTVSVPYIVTVIEEPLTFENRGNPGDDFVSRICFRNTLSMIERSTGLEKTQVKMLTDCPESISKLKTPPLKQGEQPPPFLIVYSCEQVQVLLSKGGTTLIEGYIGTIYRWAASIVGIIAVTVIVISGIQISASGGDSEAISSAKTRILQSLAGIAILFLASLILFTINPGFFTNPNSGEEVVTEP